MTHIYHAVIDGHIPYGDDWFEYESYHQTVEGAENTIRLAQMKINPVSDEWTSTEDGESSIEIGDTCYRAYIYKIEVLE